MRSCLSCDQMDYPDWGTDNWSDDCPYFPDDDEEDYDDEESEEYL